MTLAQFLDYLHGSAATTELADEFEEVLVLRVRRHVLPERATARAAG